ncbi:MAG: hypothetical protein HY811_04550 [Planctomycetes bacterium]|nr:hypothetical protein [Planctomycetota bacterium]
MKKHWKLTIGILCILCVSAVNSPAFSDSWSQTDFNSGSFNGTVSATGSADVTLASGAIGTGADGALNINSADFNINTQTQQGGRTAGDAVNFVADATNGVIDSLDNSIVLTAAPTGLAINDEVLVINLKGTSGDYANVGKYETKFISAINGNTLTFSQPISNTYGDASTQKIMVQRVPNYTDVTINAGYVMTATAWDGTKGGVIFFKASGTVTVAGTISANGLGFLGGTQPGTGVSYGGETYNGKGGAGYSQPATMQGGGGGGTAYAGVPGTGTIGSGGAGGGCGWISGTTYGGYPGYGGGGGYGTAGGGGKFGAGNGTNPAGQNGAMGTTGASGQYASGGNGGPCGGSAYYCGAGGGGGGGSVGFTDLRLLFSGSGGGAGGYLTLALNAKGGYGGGIIVIKASQISVTGLIVCNGTNGISTVDSTGGGGSGGSVCLIGNSLTLGANLVTALGGTGGGGLGAGGVGRIAVLGTATGSTNPVYATAVDGFSVPYQSSGNYISPVINPEGVTSWGVLTYTVYSPTDTSMAIDVLKALDNSLLVSNVASGTDLSAVLPQPMCYALKLRANFSTSVTSQTPKLLDWGLNYAIGGLTVTTTNWTDVCQGQAIQMGQSIAHIKFDAKTTGGTARWKRFRIDKGLKGYTNSACPDCKIEVQVWCDANGNGFWDSGDTLISKGNFSNGTCWLNMKKWQVTTTQKTYYIVYKLANDISGGTRAGVKITDSSYLEFEDATCVGVPP